MPTARPPPPLAVTEGSDGARALVSDMASCADVPCAGSGSVPDGGVTATGDDAPTMTWSESPVRIAEPLDSTAMAPLAAASPEFARTSGLSPTVTIAPSDAMTMLFPAAMMFMPPTEAWVGVSGASRSSLDTGSVAGATSAELGHASAVGVTVEDLRGRGAGPPALSDRGQALLTVWQAVVAPQALLTTRWARVDRALRRPGRSMRSLSRP